MGGARGPAGGGKVSGAGFGGKVQSVESTSGAVGSSGVAGASGAGKADPVTSQALEIVRQLKAGQISSRDEATKRLVGHILKQKLRMQSKALTQRIADALQDDPRLNKTLEHLWSQDEKG